MFKRPLIAATGCIALISAFGVYHFKGTFPESRKEYAMLIEDSSAQDEPVSHKVKQKRTEVSKDLHLFRKGERLHARLEGDEADLHLEKEGEHTVLVERLKSVTCAFQEEIFSDRAQQSVVWFDASEAHLNYRTQELAADNVRIFRYILDGKSLPQNMPSGQPLIEGFAKSMTVTLDGKEPHLAALQFKGLMQLHHRKNPSAMSIESKQADYSNGILAFNGDVSGSHPMGRVKAQMAEFVPEIKDGEKTYSKVLIQKEVDIALKHGGKVRCERAEIDDKSKKAFFTSPPEIGEVIYLDNLIDRKGNKIPLMFKSANVQIDLIPDLSNSRPRLGHMIARDKVTLVHNNDMTLTADEADYSFKSDPNRMDKLISGTIVLKSLKKEGSCLATNIQGDYVRSEEIVMNTLDSTAILIKPQGSFQTLRENKITPIAFSADKLVWQHTQDTMTLEKNAVVTDCEYGTLTTDETLVVKRIATPEGKKLLKSILSNGHTVLTHTEQDKEQTHTLICDGTTFLDNQRYTITFNSRPKGAQISFEDIFGEIKADRAVLTYKLVKDRISPQLLTLDGNLKIVNRYTSTDKNATQEQLQFALADHAEYNFENKEMILASSKQKPRVLFFDKANHFEVSAPALKIKRNMLTGKDSITGQGDVRFNLVEHELEQIKSHFKFES